MTEMQEVVAHNLASQMEESDRRLYRAECMLKCLEAKLTRIEPSEFDELMDKLEEAREEVIHCRMVQSDCRIKCENYPYLTQRIYQIMDENRRLKHHVYHG